MPPWRASPSDAVKIAHIVRRYSRAEWGGTETVVAHTIAEQAKLGHDARVFCTSALQPPEGPEPGVSCFPYLYPYWPLSRADRVALDKKGGNPYSPKLFSAVRAWRPDFIHIHAGGRLATGAVRLARALGVPCAMSLHGGATVVPQREMDEMLRPLRHKAPYGGVIDRLLGLRFDPLAQVDLVLAISHAEVARLKELHPGRRIEYLPNGVPPETPGFTPHAPRPPRHLLCVSRIDYQKNQLALVELLAARPESTLTLVGPVTAQWYAEKIRARVAELGVGSRFTLIPGLPPGSAALEAEFEKADAFVLPSVHEPFGIVALEAMQRGLPLVAASVGGLCDFVKDGENGLLFDPADPGALARTVLRLDEAAVRERIVRGGQATASDYLWPNVIARLMSLYREAGAAQ